MKRNARPLVLGLLLAAAGCADDPIGVQDAVTYHDNLSPESDAPASADSIDAYFDFSLGMGEGMRASADLNQRLSDFLRGRSVRYFRVGATMEPAPISDMLSAEANLMNLNNFKDIGSRLHGVIERSVAASTRQSVFVTDFEATLDDAILTPGAPKPHRIDTKAWAQEPFRRWLEAGHRIDVFARRYQKPDWWFTNDGSARHPNWVYTIVFTPAPLLQDDKSYRATLLALLLEDHQRSASQDDRHLAYWADDYRITTRNAQGTGNANASSPVQEAAVSRGRLPFDFHSFRYPEVAEWLNAGGTDLRLLNGVAVEPRLKFAQSVALGLRVRDVTDAVLELRNALEPPPAPDTSRDEETGKLMDNATGKPYVAPPRPAPVTAAAGEDAPNVFTYVYNSSTHEIGIKIDTAYTGPNRQVLYRVDIVIDDITLKADATPTDVLSMQYSGGFRVTALAESLRLALRDVVNSRRGLPVYSSYILFNP